jgi:hypothetical protein
LIDCFFQRLDRFRQFFGISRITVWIGQFDKLFIVLNIADKTGVIIENFLLRGEFF